MQDCKLPKLLENVGLTFILFRDRVVADGAISSVIDHLDHSGQVKKHYELHDTEMVRPLLPMSTEVDECV